MGGEAHGGPLGCCLGIVAGLFLTLFIMFSISIALANRGLLSVASLPIALLGGIIGGYLGWLIGRRLYREYEPPIVAVPQRRKRKRSRAMPK
jgi:hypothetical protein